MIVETPSVYQSWRVEWLLMVCEKRLFSLIGTAPARADSWPPRDEDFRLQFTEKLGACPASNPHLR